MLIRQYGDTDFVTGLRAIAAFMVVAIHTAAFVDFGLVGEILTDNGKYGVQIFFVISGFTVAVTYGGAASFRAYFTRRLFRIAPLYYLICGLVFVALLAGWLLPNYWMTLYGSAPDAYNAVMHLTFLSAWDARVAASLIGPEWTIPIEVFWYLCLPALLPLSTARKPFAWTMLALLLLSGGTKVVAEYLLPPHAAHFLPLSYGAYFLLGAACLPLRTTWRDAAHAGTRRRVVWGATVLFALGLVTETGFSTVLLALGTAGLIAALHVRDGAAHPLTLRPMLYLGSISYSIYLWHYVVIMGLDRYASEFYTGSGLWRFALVSAITVGLSTLTYVLVERPTNALGKRLVEGRGS